MERIAARDPYAERVYAAEDRAALAAGVRRYRTFAELTAHVEAIVTSWWWDTTFPDAPIEVVVTRRSRNATFSAAVLDEATDSAMIAIVDGRHWNTSVVLHELAHVAVGRGQDHNERFRAALVELWRREAGFFAYAILREEFRNAGLAC